MTKRSYKVYLRESIGRFSKSDFNILQIQYRLYVQNIQVSNLVLVKCTPQDSVPLTSSYFHFPMMLFQFRPRYDVVTAILLPHSLTQALHPPRLSNQIITIVDKTPYNGSALPGDSLPDITNHIDPRFDLFNVESPDMHSNPCAWFVFCFNSQSLLRPSSTLLCVFPNSKRSRNRAHHTAKAFSHTLLRLRDEEHPDKDCRKRVLLRVLIQGEITTSLTETTPHVSFNITSHLLNNRTGLVPDEEAFYN